MESDLREDYMEDVVLIQPAGTFHGVESSRRLLREAVPDARGVESFVVKDGLIVRQTASYVVGAGRDSSVLG